MRDRVVLIVTAIIGTFVIVSLLGQFILTYTGRIAGDEGIWRPLFDLVAILVGAVAGFIGGVEIERTRQRKNGNGHDGH